MEEDVSDSAGGTYTTWNLSADVSVLSWGAVATIWEKDEGYLSIIGGYERSQSDWQNPSQCRPMTLHQ